MVMQRPEGEACSSRKPHGSLNERSHPTRPAVPRLAVTPSHIADLRQLRAFSSLPPIAARTSQTPTVGPRLGILRAAERPSAP